MVPNNHLDKLKKPVDTFHNVPSFIYLYPQYLENMKKQIIHALEDINDNSKNTLFKNSRINGLDSDYLPLPKNTWIGFNKNLSIRKRFKELRNLSAAKGPVDAFHNVPSFIYLYPQYLDNIKKQIIHALKDINDKNAKIINRIVLPIENGIINSVSIANNDFSTLKFESVVPLHEMRSGLGIKIRGRNNSQLFCIVDTGAMESVLPIGELHNFKILKYLPKLKLKSVSQDTVESVHRAVIEMFMPGYGLTYQPVTFVNDLNCGLLGLPLLKKLQASIVNTKNKFYLGFGRINATQVNEMVIVNDLTIDPVSYVSSEIQVKLDHYDGVKIGKNTIYVEGDKNIAPCIAVLDHNGSSQPSTLSCYLINASNEPVTIKKGTKYPIELDPNFRKQNNFDISKFSYELTPIDCSDEELRVINQIYEVPVYSNTAVQCDDSIIERDMGGNPGSLGAELECVPAPQITSEQRKKYIYEEIDKRNYSNPELVKILKHNFEAFSASKWDCGEIKEAVDFPFNRDFHKNFKAYSVSPDKKKYVDEVIQNLLFHKKIIKSDLGFGSPIFVVPRRSSPGAPTNLQSYRLIIDARMVSKSTNFGVSAIMDSTTSIIDEIASCRYLSSLDITKAYFALRISQNIIDSGFNNFVCSSGTYTLLSILTGGSNAPYVLQCIIKKYLNNNCNGQFDPISLSLINSWYDDIHLSTKEHHNIPVHLADLNTLLSRIRNSGLRLSFDKCRFLIDLKYEEINCLGFSIGQNKIRPNEEKLSALKKINIPKNLRQLQVYLGSLQYFRRLLPLKAGSLISIMSNYASEGKFKRDKVFDDTFEEIQKSLYNVSTFLPFPEQTCVCFSDASGKYFGGVLFSVNNRAIMNDLKGSIIDENKVERSKVSDTVNSILKDHPIDWINELTPISSSHSLIKIFCQYANIIDTIVWEPDVLKKKIEEEIFHLGSELKNMIGFSEKLSPIEIENKQKEFFNNIQEANFEKSLSKEMQDTLETFYFKSFTKIFKRDIILINKTGFCRIGQLNYRSPLILFFNKEDNLYSSFTSAKKYLDFTESLKKSVEHFSAEEISKQLFRLFKTTGASQFIRPVGYHTKTFSPSELTKPIYIKELSAMYYTLKAFEDIIQSSRCVLLSDSLPATQIMKSARSRDATVYSLIVKLAGEFPNLGIQYTPGHSNLADIFSRPTCEESIIEFANNHIPRWDPMTQEYMFFDNINDWVACRRKEQSDESGDAVQGNTEPINMAIIECKNLEIEKKENSTRVEINSLFENDLARLELTSNEQLPSNLLGGPVSLNTIFNHISLAAAYTTREIEEYSKKYAEKRGIFVDENGKVVLPQKMYYYAIGNAHVLRGHCGPTELNDYVRSAYSFSDKKDMKNKIVQFCKACIPCLTTKPQTIPFKQGSQYLLVTKPRYLVSADVMEFQRIQNSTKHNYFTRSWLLITDHYSHLTIGVPINNNNESEITRGFMFFCANYGCPENLLTDNASPFKSAGLIKLLKELGIHKIDSAVYQSRARATIERKIRSIREIICLLNTNVMSQDNLAVLRALRIYNTMPSTKNGMSPLELHYSFHPDSLAFLSNTRKHPWNAKRREINLEIRRVKEKERLKREILWKKQNKNRKEFKGNVGDLCVVRAKHQNKSQNLFGRDLWRIVQKHTYTALLARTSDNLSQVRNGSEIKIVYSPGKNEKFPKELVDNFDLVTYTGNVLNSQEHLIVEPRQTRGKTKSLEVKLDDNDEESEEEYIEETDPSIFRDIDIPNSVSKKVHFNPKVSTKYIDQLLNG